MSLTLHLDASDTGQLWTTFQASGVHTGTPSNGSIVQVWDDEGDGVTDVCLIAPAADTAKSPLWRSSSPLMINPCLDFDGTDDTLHTYTQTGSVKAISNFLTNAAYTIIIACYAESITSTATPGAGHALIGDLVGYMGLFLYTVSGQRKVELINYTTSFQILTANITEATTLLLMARHDAGNLYLSVNGGAEIGPTTAGNTGDVTNRLSLGLISGAVAFNGRIGELKIWNTGNADGNLASEIAAMMSKWVTPAGASTPLALSASLTLAGQIAKRLNKPFAGAI